MGQESVRETIDEMRHSAIEDVVMRGIPPESYPEQWDVDGLAASVKQVLNLDVPVADWAKEEGIADEEIRERLFKEADGAYRERVSKNSPEVMTYVEKQILLQTLDHLWREHLVTLDHLRQVIGWRGYAQRDPLNEYKSEAFQLFDGMTQRLAEHVTGQLMRVEVMFEPPPEPEMPPMQAHHFNPLTGEDELQLAALSAMPTPTGKRGQPLIRATRRVGARSGGTMLAPADRARSSSTATVSSRDVAAQRRLVVANRLTALRVPSDCRSCYFGSAPIWLAMRSSETVAMKAVLHQLDRPDPVTSPRGSVVFTKHSFLPRSVSW